MVILLSSVLAVEDALHWIAELHVAHAPVERLLLLSRIDLSLRTARVVDLRCACVGRWAGWHAAWCLRTEAVLGALVAVTLRSFLVLFVDRALNATTGHGASI